MIYVVKYFIKTKENIESINLKMKRTLPDCEVEIILAGLIPGLITSSIITPFWT